MSNDLYVILVHFNPRRLKVRARQYLETAKELRRQGAKIVRVEVRFHDNPFEVTSWWGRNHIRLSTREETWNKECAINNAARHVFRKHPDARHIAWMDADIVCVRPDWVEATIATLKLHPAVQLFSNAIDLNPKQDFMGRAHGFARLLAEGQRPGDFERNKQKYPTHMHSGYGWAFRRETWEAVGGMPTFGVLGSGDYIMACGLAGHADVAVPEGVSPGYAQAILDWGAKAHNVVQGDIGHVEGLILHKFHGYKEHRGYKTRPQILKDSQFDPAADLTYDDQGLPIIVGKPRLRAAISRYMSTRKEYDLTTALEQPLPRRWWKLFPLFQ
jgi:hypothetical protein